MTTSGDLCKLRTYEGARAVEHWHCDDYPNGTVTSVGTGRVLKRGDRPE